MNKINLVLGVFVCAAMAFISCERNNAGKDTTPPILTVTALDTINAQSGIPHSVVFPSSTPIPIHSVNGGVVVNFTATDDQKLGSFTYSINPAFTPATTDSVWQTSVNDTTSAKSVNKVLQIVPFFLTQNPVNDKEGVYTLDLKATDASGNSSTTFEQKFQFYKK